MVKLPQIPLPGEEKLKLDHAYRIVSCEEFFSELRNYHGLRVTLNGGTDDLIAVPLWLRETAGRKSKIGAFVSVLGEDVDRWVGKVIVFREWKPRNRVIEEVKQ